MKKIISTDLNLTKKNPNRRTDQAEQLREILQTIKLIDVNSLIANSCGEIAGMT